VPNLYTESKTCLEYSFLVASFINFSYSEYETSTFTWNYTVLQQLTNPSITFSEGNIAYKKVKGPATWTYTYHFQFCSLNEDHRKQETSVAQSNSDHHSQLSETKKIQGLIRCSTLIRVNTKYLEEGDYHTPQYLIC
jgi:hypothetical protein